MNFRRSRRDDAPDLNLVPLIDVLLVILIFLAASTSFTRMQQLQVALPQAQADAALNETLDIAISRDGLYAIQGQVVDGDTHELAQALLAMRSGADQALVIHADAQASHASVVRVLQAARDAGMHRIHFAVQAAP